ncbi:hypothetical protein [Methanogenium cariaci]|uniref:hypothetical protein n=1 Tax=Methanogenium cariaci TaxID=2197 RepID=UPI000785B1F1|nr:hypothetical protein [Methanogenium cariaci]
MDVGLSEELSRRVTGLEETVKDLTEDIPPRMNLETSEEFSRRVTELERVVKRLASSPAHAAPQHTRVNELEGMVKGLTEELLDLKAEVRKIGKILEGKEELRPRSDTRRARQTPEAMVQRSERTGKSPERRGGSERNKILSLHVDRWNPNRN